MLTLNRVESRDDDATTWHQLRLVAPPVYVVSPTTFGIDPFDDDQLGVYRCPLGHVAGLNVISEVTIEIRGWAMTWYVHISTSAKGYHFGRNRFSLFRKHFTASSMT